MRTSFSWEEKAGMVLSVSGWTWGVRSSRTHAIPECLRGAFTTRRNTNPRLPLPLPTGQGWWYCWLVWNDVATLHYNGTTRKSWRKVVQQFAIYELHKWRRELDKDMDLIKSIIITANKIVSKIRRSLTSNCRSVRLHRRSAVGLVVSFDLWPFDLKIYSVHLCPQLHWTCTLRKIPPKNL